MKHLDVFTNIVNAVSEKSFSGIAVIDFESWKPIFRQNWASLNQYREFSKEIVRKKWSSLNNTYMEKEAVLNFETHARIFMEGTLKLAKELRPFAKWGYYGYPYCYNFSPGL